MGRKKKITVGTDCSGIEAPIQALMRLGIPFKHKFSSDIDKYCKIVSDEIYKPEVFYDNLMERDNTKAPPVDLYVAGFPCQSFSIAGKRAGFDDIRGTVFFGCADYIREKQPDVFVLENVKGILSSKTDSQLPNILLSLLSEFQTIISWQKKDTITQNIPKSNLDSLSRIMSVYLREKLLGNLESRNVQLDTYSIRSSASAYAKLVQEVKLGLIQRLKYCEMKISQIMKKSSYYRDEQIPLPEYKEADWDLSPSLSPFIGDLRVTVMSMLDIKEDISKDVGLFANDFWEGNLNQQKLSTILMEINTMMNQKTCMYVLEMNIIRLIGVLSGLCPNYLKKALLISTEKREGTSYIGSLDIIMAILKILGYDLHTAVLNTKEHGIPQNRERWFCVGFKEPRDYRFPKPFPLELRLKDLLEESVDEKYYLSDRLIKTLLKHTNKENGHHFETDKPVANTLRRDTAKMGTDDTYVTDEPMIKFGTSQDQKLSNTDGVSQTLNSGHFNQPKIIEPQIVASRGRGENNEQQMEAREDGVTNSLTSVQKDNLVVEPNLKQVGSLYEGNSDAGRIYDSEGIACNQKAEGGGLGAKTGLYQVDGKPPRLLTMDDPEVKKRNLTQEEVDGINEYIKEKESELYMIACDCGHEFKGKLSDKCPSCKEIRSGSTNEVRQLNPSKESGGKQPYQHRRIYDTEGISPALQAEMGGERSHNINTSRIRRLTPLECLRLQDFPDTFHDQLKELNISDTQIYRMAGNSMSCNVMELIIKNIYG